ncbi:MAG: Crp/Fnr family transcriptional regulator [Sediminibacterium sp.]
MEELLAYFQSLHPLTPEIQSALLSRSTKEIHRKRKTLLYAGQFCDWVGFIEKGMIKTCYDITGGDERIISFAREGEIACAIKSYTSNTASRMSLVTMDNTIVWKIRKLELEDIAIRFPEFHIHLRRVVEVQMMLLEDHYLLLSLAPRKRLEQMEREQAWLLKDPRIWDYSVADYLGIDRATFSRWRKGK